MLGAAHRRLMTMTIKSLDYRVVVVWMPFAVASAGRGTELLIAGDVARNRLVNLARALRRSQRGLPPGSEVIMAGYPIVRPRCLARV
jgi:hypothetical protein